MATTQFLPFGTRATGGKFLSWKTFDKQIIYIQNRRMKHWDGKKLQQMIEEHDVQSKDIILAAEKLGVKLSLSSIYYHKQPGSNPPVGIVAFYAHVFACRMENFLSGRWDRIK